LQVQENTKDIKVGTIIALMVAEGEDWRSVEVPLSSDTASLAPSSLPSVPGPKPGTGSNDTADLFDINRFFLSFYPFL
jgi:hypothetical protein